jgi:hypothetical protein
MGLMCTHVLSGCISLLTENFIKYEKSKLLPHTHGVDGRITFVCYRMYMGLMILGKREITYS